MPVRWSQALNFQIFLTFTKQRRNSEETDSPHRKMAAENMRRSDISPAGPALPSAKRSTGRFSLACIKTGKLGEFSSASLGCIRLSTDFGVCRAAGTQLKQFYGDAVTDDFHTNNDAAISKLEDTVRELETRHEMLIAKLSNPTEQMMLAGALAHNEGLRPLRAAVTASEAKKIFMAMIAVLKESMV
jgi:hypothetical protein